MPDLRGGIEPAFDSETAHFHSLEGFEESFLLAFKF